MMEKVRTILSSLFGEWLGHTALSRRRIFGAALLNILVAVGSLAGPFVVTLHSDHPGTVWIMCGLMFMLSAGRAIINLLQVMCPEDEETDLLVSVAGGCSLLGTFIISLIALPSLTGWSATAVIAVMVYRVVTGLGALAYPTLRWSAETAAENHSELLDNLNQKLADRTC